jgi:hypothetical protein
MNVRLAWSRASFALLLCCLSPVACGEPSDDDFADEGGDAANPDDRGSQADPQADDFALPHGSAPHGSLSAPSDDQPSGPDADDDLGVPPANDPDDQAEPEQPPDLTPHTTTEIERPITLTQQALLPEALPDFVRAQVDEDALTLQFSGPSASAIKVGSVLAGHAQGGYLRRVVAVELTSDGRVRASTVEAALTELVADGHFRVTAAKAPADQVQKLLIAQPKALPCTLEATGEVVDITPSYSFDPELDLEVDIALDPATHLPVLHVARAAVHGELTMSATLGVKGKVHGHCSADLLAALEPVSWSTNIALGLLPVTIRHHLGPSLVVALDLLLEGGLTGTASVTVSLDAAVEYGCGGFRPVAWDAAVTGGFDVQPTARGTLTASLTPSIGYDLELLGVASASLGVRADLVGKAQADAVACTWDARLDASVTAYAHAHLDIPIVGSSLLDLDEERTLWSSTLAQDMGTLPFCR